MWACGWKIAAGDAGWLGGVVGCWRRGERGCGYWMILSVREERTFKEIVLRTAEVHRIAILQEYADGLAAEYQHRYERESRGASG